MATITSTPQQRADEQWDTVKRLNALSNHHHTVEADALDVDETQGCANDTDHGLGTCYSVHMDGLCPSCAVQFLTQHLSDGDYVSIDVTR